MSRYLVEKDKIKDTYTGREYSLGEVPFLLNELYREMMVTRRDMEYAIGLKAVNRNLRVENRVLVMKLQELAWRGMVNYSDIEKEITSLCESPMEASEYIHKYEKENFDLKSKLKRLGEYNGEILM